MLLKPVVFNSENKITKCYVLVYPERDGSWQYSSFGLNGQWQGGSYAAKRTKQEHAPIGIDCLGDSSELYG